MVEDIQKTWILISLMTSIILMGCGRNLFWQIIGFVAFITILALIPSP